MTVILPDLLRQHLEGILDVRGEPYRIVVIRQLLFNKLSGRLNLNEDFQEKENLYRSRTSVLEPIFQGRLFGCVVDVASVHFLVE